MDGLTLLKEIRKEGHDIRCIILSGYDDFEYVREAARLGIENYLLKPVNPNELSSTILNTIEKIESDLYKKMKSREDFNIFIDNIYPKVSISRCFIVTHNHLSGGGINGDHPSTRQTLWHNVRLRVSFLLGQGKEDQSGEKAVNRTSGPRVGGDCPQWSGAE